MIDSEIRCTGQNCPDREECLRWLLPVNPHKAKWASFDIERKHFGNCPVKTILGKSHEVKKD